MISSDQQNIVDRLVEEFMDRRQKGEAPSIDEYCELHPELAEEIRDVFEALMMVEDLKPGSQDESGTFGKSVPVGQRLDQVGDYRILNEIGRGGMGIVYEAEQLSLGRRVAVKVLPQQVAGSGKALARFQREAKAAARMHHTNIVPVFDVGTDSEHVYYVMQLIQGQGLDLVIDDLQRLRQESSVGVLDGAAGNKPARQDLRSDAAPSIAHSLITGQFEPVRLDGQLELGGKNASGKDAYELTETIALKAGSSISASLPGKSDVSTAEEDRHAYHISVAEIGQQAASALAYAHARGIIHRDIKPSNLLLDSVGIVWVTDFGLAKTGDEALTHTGDILGTIRYMSPERFRGQCDVRADIYSLGLTLYELITLRPAFIASDQGSLIGIINKADPATPRSIDPRVPRDLETIVLKAIDKEPRHRYQSADEMEEDLQRFIDDEPIRARRISMVERFTRWSRRNKALAASLSIAAALMLVINVVGPLVTWEIWKLHEEQERLVGERNNRVRELVKKEQLLSANKTRLEEEQEALMAEQEMTANTVYALQMTTAARALETPGGYREYQELLAKTRPQPDEPDHRGWEWFFLNTPHNDGVETIATDAEMPDTVRFSPDGKKLAYAGSSGMITIRDMEADRNLFAFSAHADRILGLAWSPDGQQIVSGGLDHTVRIWDAATGLEQFAFSDLDQRVEAVAWSPDGAKIAAGGRDGGLYVWDTNTWHAWGKTREPSKGKISEVCWNPDSRRLLTADTAGKLIVWDVETGVSTPLENGRRTEMTRSINWTAAGYNPKGNLIAAVDDLGLLTVWQEDTDTGEISRLGRLQAHSSKVGQLTWDPRPESQCFATVCKDGTVTVWNASTPGTPERVRTHQHGHSAHDVSWDSQHDRLAFASRTESISVWNLDESVRPNGIETNARWVRSVAYSSDAKWIASAGGSRGPGWGPDVLEVHNRGTNESERLKIDANSRVLDLAFSPDGKWLATGDTSNNLILWNTTTWNPIHIESAKDAIFCLAWSLDGKTIATGTANRNPFGNRPHPIVDTITLWNVSDDGQLSQSWNSEQPGEVFDLTFHPKDNTRLAAAVVKKSDAGSTSSILIWDTGRGSDPISSMTMPEESISCLLWHPEDADRLATASMKETYDDSVGTLRIFDVTNWQEVQQMTGHHNRISSMTWNKHGTRLLSGGWDGTVRLWQPVTGTELLKIPSDRIILGVALSPCDFQIAATGSGSAIDVYDATEGYLRDRSPKILEHGGRMAMGRDANANDLLTRAELHLQSRPPNWEAADRDFYLAADRSEENGPGWIQSPWRVVGPYPFPDASTAKSSPEQQLPTVNVAQSVLAADGNTQLFWQQVERQKDHGIDFSRHFDRSATESCYATCNIYASEDMRVGLMFGARSHHRLWLNGEVVHEGQTDGQIAPRDYVRLVSLKAGRNTLLMRIANRSGNHAMFLEISANPSVLADAFEHTTGERSDYAAALRQWKLALDEEPNRADLLLRHSRAAQMLGDFKTALDSLSSLLDVYDRKGSTPPIKIQLEKGELHAFSELKRRTPIPEGSIWKWLHPIDGISPTASIPGFNRDFSQLEFDDRNWNIGQDSTDLGGGFRGGYPDEPKAIDIGTPPSGTVSSAYFRCMFTTVEPLERLAIQMRMNDGVIVYLDGQEIGRNNIAKEENEDFRLSTQNAVTEIIATFSPRTQLAAGKHVLAISLHGIGPANTNYLLANISLSGSSGPISQPLTLDDPAVLLGRGLTYAELGPPDRATADIALAVEKIRRQPNENWRPQLMQAVSNRLAPRPSPNITSELLAPVVELLPESRPLQLQLALAAVREQKWEKVAISLGEAVRLAPNAHKEACQLCVVLIHNNDLDGYRKLRSQILESWQGSSSPWNVQRVARARTCLLLPAEGDELTDVGDLADLVLSTTPQENQALNRWFVVTKGLAEYRRGNFESALQQLAQFYPTFINRDKRSLTRDLLLAMSHHQLGHLVEAKKLLQTARQSIKQDVPPDLESYDIELMCLILLREAEELINSK